MGLQMPSLRSRLNWIPGFRLSSPLVAAGAAGQAHPFAEVGEQDGVFGVLRSCSEPSLHVVPDRALSGHAAIPLRRLPHRPRRGERGGMPHGLGRLAHLARRPAPVIVARLIGPGLCLCLCHGQTRTLTCNRLVVSSIVLVVGIRLLVGSLAAPSDS